MTAAIIVYVLIVTLPLVAAAALTERVCRLWSWPVRGVWAATALLIALIGARAIVQQTVTPATISISQIHVMHAMNPRAAGNVTGMTEVVDGLIAFPRSAGAYIAHALGPAQSRVLAVLWCAMSIAMLALVCLVYVRVWRARRDWKMTDLAGVRVRVSPNAGPAVVGLFSPEIVVPRWMLAAAPEDSHLVVMHEMEHRNARDPLLLAVMWSLVALIPWHPGAWYCLARTRLAIELDCDARVVKRGASLRTYAQLLLHQARVRLNAPTHMWLGATSLLEPSSHLERRLNAMILPDKNSRAQRPIVRYLRTLSYLAVVSTIAVAACESHVPTAADITGLDAASAEKNARDASILNGQPVTYYVDNVKVSADSAHAITAADISALTISKQGPQQQVRVFTIPDGRHGDFVRDSLQTGRPSGKTFRVTVDTTRVFVSADSSRHQTHLVGDKAGKPFAGAVIIDGVSSDLAAMKSLDPSRIASVEVIKGPAAVAQSTDPRAVNGIISITLKH